MFVILPDEVMNEWAEWLAKKSFDLTATGIFSVELPAKQLGLIQACTPRSTINRLYSLRNGFWLSESPWAYVGTMHDDWPRMILTAMRQLVMETIRRPPSRRRVPLRRHRFAPARSLR